MFKKLTLSAILFTASAPAFAHPGHADLSPLTQGLLHPFLGLDHMLVMLTVGIWAAFLGGKARIAVPAAFVITMIGGFTLALSGIALPFVEPAILGSIVVLGLLVAMAVHTPMAGSAAIVAVFALFHGHAHGTEFIGVHTAQFGLGFMISTALLHGFGIALGMIAGRWEHSARFLGAGAAVAGLAMIVS